MLIGDLAVDATSSVILAKAAISALLLYLSVHRVNFGRVGERLGTLNFGWLVFMLIALCVQTLLLALRWREIVGICGARLHLTAGLSYSLIGLFSVKRCPHLANGPGRGWMADGKLFSATRPGGWRNGIGDPGRRLLAVDEGLFRARARGRVHRQVL